MAKIPPVHPGEVLLEEFLKPWGVSQNRLNGIVRGRQGITGDTALRLAPHPHYLRIHPPGFSQESLNL